MFLLYQVIEQVRFNFRQSQSIKTVALERWGETMLHKLFISTCLCFIIVLYCRATFQMDLETSQLDSTINQQQSTPIHPSSIHTIFTLLITPFPTPMFTSKFLLLQKNPSRANVFHMLRVPVTVNQNQVPHFMLRTKVITVQTSRPCCLWQLSAM